MTADLQRRALYLSYFTVVYNIIEGIVSIIAGTVAGSIALIGFGFDSFIESISGGIIIWRFGKHGNSLPKKELEVEKKAIRLIGYSFFIFAAYVLYQSVTKLLFAEMPEASLFGIIIAVVSLIVMPVLFLLKYVTGKTMQSRSVIADSKQTLACIFLSVALLLGLGANYLFGYWWADPLVGLIIAAYLVREGFETLREERLCSC